ncbi:hypothetical protein D3C85_1333460 [compost metagenome]
MPTPHTRFSGVGVRQLNAITNSVCAVLIGDGLRTEGAAFLLLEAVNDRNTVIARLHRPNLISLGAKRLLGIRLHPNINQHRLSIHVHHEMSDVIMIMAFIVVTAFDRYK